MQAQEDQLPGSAKKQAGRDPQLSPKHQQADPKPQAVQQLSPAKPVFTQPPDSGSSSAASSSSEDGAEEVYAPSQKQAASEPVIRAQASEQIREAEQIERQERGKNSKATEESEQQQKGTAQKGAEGDSESWHSLQEERALPGASQKAVPTTPQSHHLPASQNARVQTPPSQRLPVKPAQAAGISTPVPIEPATGAHCSPARGAAGKRSVPASLQAGFLWSPDQTGVLTK